VIDNELKIIQERLELVESLLGIVCDEVAFFTSPIVDDDGGR